MLDTRKCAWCNIGIPAEEPSPTSGPDYCSGICAALLSLPQAAQVYVRRLEGTP